MSKIKTPKTRSAVELAQAARSPVVQAMIGRGTAGAGRDGGSVRDHNRRDRKRSRQDLRAGREC